MKIAINSNIGKRRTSNQDYADYFENNFEQTLFILCDGVGGHLAGDVASQRTTHYLGELFQKLEHPLTQDKAMEWLYYTIQEVNTRIYDDASQDPNLTGMGTTLVTALVIDRLIFIAHVGDSRAYLYNKGTLTQLTEDHSLVNELVRAGEITLEQSFVHPHRNAVTQSIGLAKQVKIEFKILNFDEIEQLMLCSDGLTNMLNQEELLSLFNEHRENQNFAQLLVDKANEAGGTDNISVIILSHLENKKVEEVSEWK